MLTPAPWRILGAEEGGTEESVENLLSDQRCEADGWGVEATGRSIEWVI
jgi:hypothetical protein